MMAVNEQQRSGMQKYTAKLLSETAQDQWKGGDGYGCRVSLVTQYGVLETENEKSEVEQNERKSKKISFRYAFGNDNLHFLCAAADNLCGGAGACGV